MARQLYELCGRDPELVFSPYCWRARMALAHKGLGFTSIPWRFTEGANLDFAKHDKVPVLVDGAAVVPDSWAIAQHLDAAYPETPALLHGRPASYRFIAAWAESVISAGLARLIVSDIPALLDDADRAYFVESREQRFGRPLAQVTADREAQLPAFRASLQPLRMVVKTELYLGGEEPDYADYAVFGSFMWARCVSPLRVLAADDSVFAWQERMLDLHGGVARNAPAVGG